MNLAYLDDKDECNDISIGIDISEDYTQTNNVSDDSLIKMRAQWTEELKQVEDEIQTLRQVLLSKFRRQQFLKRQLGITPIEELKSEVKQGLDTLRTSDAYLKTSAVVKTAKDKTSAVFIEKWNLLRQTSTYKSLENKVGSACYNVYGKLTRPKTLSSGTEQISHSENTTTTTTTTFGAADITKKSCNLGTNNNSVPQSVSVISSSSLSSSSSFNPNNSKSNNYDEDNIEINGDDSIDFDKLLNDDMLLHSNRIDNKK
ncbi:unnamed protein product [Schistosoma rodhaini]|uniref:Uncharacterized protein n=1 Tax=Schistosoma rodhaini TaxID=6188 RepID=A0AA85GFY1_9TREM|nr:unnamed protein product [Schistosoma rodhaini]CAH8646828.1 unnamed protein product [Schistosoma rodhaini]